MNEFGCAMGNNTMKRLGIFIFYDKDGVVDRYIEFLLHSLKEVTDRLVIVVNGLINSEGIEQLELISNDIIYRDNKGYDAGGYRTALLRDVGSKELQKYDELILCNDTCYGPFVPLPVIWDKMDQKDGDFWGINCIVNELTSHMQAYFLVFRKRLLENGFLYRFFEKNINEECDDIREIVAVFEKGLFKELTESGYKAVTYIENNNLNAYICGNKLLKEYGFPFLKKKCFDERYNDNLYSAIDSVQWIADNTSYDVDMILENAKRLFGFTYSGAGILSQEEKVIYGPVFSISADMLNSFINKADRLYIYGCGAYAKEIYHLYVKESGKLKAFVVSDNKEENGTDLYGYPIINISDLEIDAPLIVALSKKNTAEVRENIKQKNVIYLF